MLQIFGVIEDRGFTSIDPVGDKTLGTQIVRLLLVQFIMAGGFMVAFEMRQSSIKSLRDLDTALRDLSARDALLAEAELARAEVLAVDVPGRYSD